MDLSFEVSHDRNIKLAMSTFLPPANEVCEGYVFTRVCLFTEGGTWAGTPLGRYTPPAGTPQKVDSLGRYTPLARYPTGQVPPLSSGRYPPPLQVYPPGQIHPPGRYTPLGRYSPPLQVHPPGQVHPPPRAVHARRYGQQAGGTHPTGMHSSYSA